MQRNWIIPGAVLLILAIILIVFPSSATDKRKAAAPTCCKKSMKQCRGDKDNAPGELIMENISRQFISIPLFIH